MRIALVLGSGGARGFAHIGVIDELAARGHQIVAISGASMGALIGGVWAVGKLDDFTEQVLAMSKTQIWRLASLTLTSAGLIKMERLMGWLYKFIGDVRIEDLDVPYIAVASDLTHQREVWFTTGPLLAAIRASVAIPGVFEPVMFKGRVLSDGGLLNPLPAGTLNSLNGINPDLTIGVSLFGRHLSLEGAGPHEESSDESTPEHPGLVTKIGDALSEALKSKPIKPLQDFGKLPNDLDLPDMVTTALDVMQARIQASRLATEPPDVLVDVPFQTAAALQFHDAKRIMELGRQLAVDKFDRVGL